MNGIYDFECYKPPHLDVEMLMERKAQKQARKIMVLSGIAAILMAVLAVMLFDMIAAESATLFAVFATMFGGYIIGGVLLIGRFIKKGEYQCEE
ncbi:MAG: hypothetical protein E7269_01530 [Lachnospiraceae bacterium]|nr:hypothetical protein [Lachnospiraceae bacterium]